MLTPSSIQRPGEGVTVVCVETHFTVQYGDLNTGKAEDGMVSHGNLVRELVREQAPYAKVLCSGHPPNTLGGRGIDIINLSLADADSFGCEDGPIWNDPTYRSYIRNWLELGIIVVAATGNINADIDRTLANCDPRLIVVGANDWDPGSDGLFRTDVLASARTVNPNRQGTSYAAPRVSGICAVLLSLADKMGTTTDMRRLIRRTRDEDGTINPTKAIDELIGFPRAYDHDGDGKVGFGDFLKLVSTSVWNSNRDRMIRGIENA